MKLSNLKKTSCSLRAETTIFMTCKKRNTYHDLNTVTYVPPRTWEYVTQAIRSCNTFKKI